MARIVSCFYGYGIWTNIDLIVLLASSTEAAWVASWQNYEIMCNVVKSDFITCLLNYLATLDYAS